MSAGSWDSATRRPERSGRRHHERGTCDLTVAFLVNDILMALFFALAAKEVWEAMLPGGALSNPRRAATPLLATVGGLIGPALLYILGAVLVGQSGWFGQEGDLARGWAVPCATDIAFSYLVARAIFGVGHPAIAFLLLLAIADDAAGLAILAIAYPQAPLQPAWLLLTRGGDRHRAAVATPAVPQLVVVSADPRHPILAVVLLLWHSRGLGTGADHSLPAARAQRPGDLRAGGNEAARHLERV